MLGTRMLFIPPSLTLILRQRLERVWGEGRRMFFTWTHCVATPRRVSPTLFTSAREREKKKERERERERSGGDRIQHIICKNDAKGLKTTFVCIAN